MNRLPNIRHALRVADEYRPEPPRKTPGERTASAIARAASNPIRTSFAWSAGGLLADAVFGLLRTLLLLIAVIALAWGTWTLTKKEPSTQAIKSQPAIEKPNRQIDRKRQ